MIQDLEWLSFEVKLFIIIYYTINQIEMCRIFLNQMLRNKISDWFIHLLWKIIKHTKCD